MDITKMAKVIIAISGLGVLMGAVLSVGMLALIIVAMLWLLGFI